MSNEALHPTGADGHHDEFAVAIATGLRFPHIERPSAGELWRLGVTQLHCDMNAFLFFTAVTLPLGLARVHTDQPVAAQGATAVAFVKQMYGEYSWETKDFMAPGREPLFTAPDPVLRKYFDPKVVAAILADRACQEHVHGECNLDFEPMWNSQDPGGATVHVSSTRIPTTVDARIHYNYGNRTFLVRYQLRQTPAGWRVADMGASEWPSLLKLLQRRVP